MSLSRNSDIDEDVSAFLSISDPPPQSQTSEPPMGPSINIKVVLVGDGAVGKTSLLRRYESDFFNPEYISPFFDNFHKRVNYRGKTYELGLWDTAGQEDYDRLRPLAYAETDIFLVCFSLEKPNSGTCSLDAVSEKWIPEITSHCPGVPYILVGCKLDLRRERAMEKATGRPSSEIREDSSVLSVFAGWRKAVEVGALTYEECSAKTNLNVGKTFQAAIRVVAARNMCIKRSRGGIFGRLFRKKGYAVDQANLKVAVLFETSSLMEDQRIKLAAAETEERERLIGILREQMDEAKAFYEEIGSLLTRDIVVEILSEFHSMDIEKDLREFDPDLPLILENYARRTQPGILQLQFYGYFADDPRRNVFQVFFNFQTSRSYSTALQFLPQMKTFVIGNQSNSPMVVFQDYHSHEVRVSELHSMKKSDFDFWTSDGKGESVCVAKLELDNDHRFPEMLCRRCPDLETLFLLRQNVVTQTGPSSETSGLVFTRLRHLRLLRFSVGTGLSFSFPLLQKVEIVASSLRDAVRLESAHLRTLSSLPHLRHVHLGHVFLLASPSIFLRGHQSLEHFAIHGCDFQFGSLSECVFHETCPLRYCAIVVLVTSQRFPEGFVDSARQLSASCEDFRFFFRNASEKYGNEEDESRFLSPAPVL